MQIAIFDTVSTIDDLSDCEPMQSHFHLDFVRKLAQKVTSKSKYCNLEMTREEAFWETLCGGMECYPENSKFLVCRLESYSGLNKVNKLFMGGQSDPPIDLELNCMLGMITDVVTERVFITTEKGYFGWAPERCKPGDVVAILAGGDVPYVMREVVSGSDLPQCYEVLGDSYVHGIMDGEAFELLGISRSSMGSILLV